MYPMWLSEVFSVCSPACKLHFHPGLYVPKPIEADRSKILERILPSMNFLTFPVSARLPKTKFESELFMPSRIAFLFYCNTRQHNIAMCTINHPILHHIFTPHFIVPQSQNPRNRYTIPMVLLNRLGKIWHKSEYNLGQFIFATFLKAPSLGCSYQIEHIGFRR